MNLTFSIITCTFNSEAFIKKNIGSVLCQKNEDYEHIFVDAYSSDNTLKIINEYKNNSRQIIRLIINKPRGVSNAMNEGIKIARGKYIIHLHSDDSFADDNVLSDVKKYFDHNQTLDWIYGKMRVIENNGNEVGIFPRQKLFHLNIGYIIKYFDYIPHQSVFIRRSVFDRFGYFDEKLKAYMDTEFWLRIKDKTHWKYFDRVIANYSLRDNAISSGKKYKKMNEKYLEMVRGKYLNIFEIYIARLLRKCLLMRADFYR